MTLRAALLFGLVFLFSFPLRAQLEPDLQIDFPAGAPFVLLSWNPVYDGALYQVYELEDGLFGSRTLLATTTASAFTVPISNPMVEIPRLFFVNAIVQGTSIPQEGLFACYPLDGDGNDLLENHDGVLSGAVSANNRFLDPDKCLHFDGENDHILLHPPLSPEQVSVSCWFKVEEEMADGFYSFIRHRPHSFHLFLEVIDGAVSIGSDVWISPSTRFLYRPQDGRINGKWHHMATTYNGYDHAVYLDGTMVFLEGQDDHAPVYYEPGGSAIGMDGNYPDRFFHGAIDDIALYDRALSHDEIIDLFVAPAFSASIID